MTLEDEYSPKAAERSAQRQQEINRKDQQRRKAQTQPIKDADQLSSEVAKLAQAWGLKKKTR